MRYEQVVNVLRLATRLQGASGLTLDDMKDEFDVSRRTAERMRDAVEQSFGPLEAVASLDRRKHWRLDSNPLRDLLPVSADELVELQTAAAGLERTGFDERARLLRDLAAKLQALLGRSVRRRVEPDLDALMMAEGLATRPGPRPRLEPDLAAKLREAIKASRVISFGYISRMTGRRSHQRVRPHGILYGSLAYLAGRSDWTQEMRYWVLANMSDVTVTGEAFEYDEEFSLREFASRSFGVFQEEPLDVRLRVAPSAASDAAAFLFHPEQEMTKHEDGSLTVCFRAGGTREMCWHLFTWGEKVVVEEPESLRMQLAQMCSRLNEHHRSG